MTRSESLRTLKESVFDLVVVGGGATGSGIALDAASRGLKVALVEKQDFSEGTSSRSTKLVHGGVRYLEMAIRQFSRVQYNLVRDGLYERGLFLKNAPHLAHPIQLVTPVYRWWQLPYIYAGLLIYDLLAGNRGLGRSRLLSAREALRRYPMLKAEGLKGGVLYYDGQFNDIRMNISLVLTAQKYGAVASNYLEVVHLDKTDGRISGVRVRDRLEGEDLHIRCKGVVNATGPFGDGLRQLDNPDALPLLQVSSGVHLVLDRRFSPPDTGLVVPRTEDGRVLFILPWEGHTLVGTTDEKSDVSSHPEATEGEISYLLRHLRATFDLDVTRGDIKSAWSGLRPLVCDPQTADTAKLARDHYVELSASGLLTISGGKWTTYRKMAEDTVDQAISAFSLSPVHNCLTAGMTVLGGEGDMGEVRRTLISNRGVSDSTADHLVATYGNRALEVASLVKSGFPGELVDGHPYLEAEVIYAVREEKAVRLMDVLHRRIPLALLDRRATGHALGRTLNLMAAELTWDEGRQSQERAEAERRLADGL